VITTREFGPTVEYGIGVYAIDRNKMLSGAPNPKMVSFFIDGNDPDLLPLVGDGLLPADVDGKTKPKQSAKIPLVGTQDDGGDYGAASDALHPGLDGHWNANALTRRRSSSRAAAVASFDSIFPCGVVPGTAAPSSRDCLAQPESNRSQYLDIPTPAANGGSPTGTSARTRRWSRTSRSGGPGSRGSLA
jgi:hypothetical protein